MQTGYGIGATRLPQTQHSQGSHTQLQSPLPQHLSRCSQRLPTKPLGLAAPTNQDHDQSDSTIWIHPQYFGICTSQRTLRLQKNATRSNGMWGPGARENRQTRYMGISFSWQMASLHIARTLSHTQSSYQAHQEQMTIQYSPTSTQTHHQSLHHTCWQGDTCIGWMCQSHPGNDRKKPGTLKPRRTYNVLLTQHRLTYRQIPTSLTKPLPRTIFTTCNEFQGCRHHQAFTYPIPMTTDKSCAPCSCRHQFWGCPLIFLESNPSTHPLLQPPLNLAANPPHWLPSRPNVNAIVSSKQHACTMPLLQPAQPHA